jgi:hypothetical protein
MGDERPVHHQTREGHVDPRNLPRPWGPSPIAPKPEHFEDGGKVSEPVLAVVDHHSGRQVTRLLWQ